MLKNSEELWRTLNNAESYWNLTLKNAEFYHDYVEKYTIFAEENKQQQNR